MLYLSVRYACSDTELRYYRIFGFYFNPSSSKNSRIRASDAPISIIGVKNRKTCPYGAERRLIIVLCRGSVRGGISFHQTR